MRHNPQLPAGYRLLARYMKPQYPGWRGWSRHLDGCCFDCLPACQGSLDTSILLCGNLQAYQILLSGYTGSRRTVGWAALVVLVAFSRQERWSLNQSPFKMQPDEVCSCKVCKGRPSPEHNKVLWAAWKMWGEGGVQADCIHWRTPPVQIKYVWRRSDL